MEILGYLASVLVGILLGLLGGGGSILTVPVLVYFFGIDPVSATTYSLFIVGIASLSGSIGSLPEKHIDLRIVLLFGIPSVIVIFFVRRFILPFIPDTIELTEQVRLMKSDLLMMAFAGIMLLAAISMITQKKAAEGVHYENSQAKRPVLLAAGVLLGCITGLLGAGGGFLIVPVLVFWGKLPMKTAVGTSLAIISINSMLGFSFSVGQTSIHWALFLNLTAIAVAGIFIGMRLSAYIDGLTLKRSFGVFVLLIAACIFLKELYIS